MTDKEKLEIFDNIYNFLDKHLKNDDDLFSHLTRNEETFKFILEMMAGNNNYWEIRKALNYRKWGLLDDESAASINAITNNGDGTVTLII